MGDQGGGAKGENEESGEGNKDEGGSPMIAEISRSEVEGGISESETWRCGGCQNPPERKTSFKCFWPGPMHRYMTVSLNI